MTGNKDVGVLSVSRCETPPKQSLGPSLLCGRGWPQHARQHLYCPDADIIEIFSI